MLRRCAGAGTLQANSDAGQPIQLPRCQNRPPHGLVPWHVCVRGFACSSILNSRRPRVMLWYQHVLFRVRLSFQAPGSSFVRRAMGLARAEMCLTGRHVVEDCEQEWAVTVFSVVSPPPRPPPAIGRRPSPAPAARSAGSGRLVRATWADIQGTPSECLHTLRRHALVSNVQSLP